MFYEEGLLIGIKGLLPDEGAFPFLTDIMLLFFFLYGFLIKEGGEV
jgi:hypothetical protein